MEPGRNPDDLHAILSRFHTWAEKQPGERNGNRSSNGHIRTLTYEEAIAQHRSRQANPAERRARPVRETAAAPVVPTGLSSADATPSREAPQRNEQHPAMPDPTPGPRDAESELDGATRVSSAAGIPAATAQPVALGRPLPAAQIETVTETGPDGAKSPVSTTRKAPVSAKTGKTSLPQPGRKASAKSGSSLPQAPPKTAPMPADVPKRRSAGAPVARTKPSAKIAPCRENPTTFRQVLAKSVLPEEKKAGKAGKASPSAVPERTRRITMRFSSAEQKRLERAAGEAGMTLSAYLRKCALNAGKIQAAPRAVEKPAVRAKRGRSAATAKTSAQTQLFAQPVSNSLVGGWLNLLRQRFLSSPRRFSERA